MDDIQLSLYPGDYGDVVDPVKRRQTRNTTYTDEYTYSSVHIESGLGGCLADGAKVVVEGDRFYYKYPRKVPVMVTQKGVHKHNKATVKEAEGQAFFVLSMLDAGGYVSNWSKK